MLYHCYYTIEKQHSWQTMAIPNSTVENISENRQRLWWS